MEFLLVRTRAEVEALSADVAALIRDLVAFSDATYTPEYFLARIHSRAEPRVVTCYENCALVGLFFAYELNVAGVPTGFAFGGDQMGRGLLVCAIDREREILKACCSFLLKNGIHAVRLDWTARESMPESALCMQHPPIRMKNVGDRRNEGDWLALMPKYDQFLARLGPHTRRNLRYYRRKAEAAGFTYSGMLDPVTFVDAMESLNRLADYPMEDDEVARDKRYMATFGTPVMVGLQGPDGRFVSLVTGYTAGRHLHILTQLNGEDENLRKLSISLVLRGYLIEDFIERGFTAVHFFQGSSPMLGRFCSSVDLQHISLDAPHWSMTPFKQACAWLADALYHRGKRVPYRLQWAAGSYWAEPPRRAEQAALDKNTASDALS